MGSAGVAVMLCNKVNTRLPTRSRTSVDQASQMWPGRGGRQTTTNQASYPTARPPLPAAYDTTYDTSSAELLGRLTRLPQQWQQSPSLDWAHSTLPHCSRGSPLSEGDALPAVRRLDNVLHVHLRPAAAKLNVSEERLRDSLLALKESHMRGTACRNRQDGYVSLPCQVWHSLSGANPHLLPRITHERALSETRHYPGSAQVQRRPILPQRIGTAPAAPWIAPADIMSLDTPHSSEYHDPRAVSHAKQTTPAMMRPFATLDIDRRYFIGA